VNEYTLDRLTVTDKNRTAVEAVKVFNPKSDNLYLWGPAGSGKSHLATIATRSAYAAGYTVKTVTQMSLSRHLRGAENANQEDSIIQGHADLHVLCIDDLGVGKDTEFSLSMLYEIIQGRYMNAAGGLIITSNLSLDHLAQKLGEDRIPSRLAQMCKVFSLEGEKDYRLIRRAVEAA
jgi:DNA replication protein DnaC